MVRVSFQTLGASLANNTNCRDVNRLTVPAVAKQTQMIFKTE